MTRAQARFIALLAAVCAVFVAAWSVRYGIDRGRMVALVALAGQAVLNALRGWG
jgi:hypothetical protein